MKRSSSRHRFISMYRINSPSRSFFLTHFLLFNDVNLHLFFVPTVLSLQWLMFMDQLSGTFTLGPCSATSLRLDSGIWCLVLYNFQVYSLSELRCSYEFGKKKLVAAAWQWSSGLQTPTSVHRLRRRPSMRPFVHDVAVRCVGGRYAVCIFERTNVCCDFLPFPFPHNSHLWCRGPALKNTRLLHIYTFVSTRFASLGMSSSLESGRHKSFYVGHW